MGRVEAAEIGNQRSQNHCVFAGFSAVLKFFVEFVEIQAEYGRIFVKKGVIFEGGCREKCESQLKSLRDILVDPHSNALISGSNELHKQKWNFLRRHELMLLLQTKQQLNGSILGDNYGVRMDIPTMSVLDIIAERELNSDDEEDDIPKFIFLEILLFSAAISNFIL